MGLNGRCAPRPRSCSRAWVRCPATITCAPPRPPCCGAGCRARPIPGAEHRAGRHRHDRHREPRGHPRRSGQGSARPSSRSRRGRGIRARRCRRDRRDPLPRSVLRRPARRRPAPILVEGADPGDLLKITVAPLVPRVPYGVISNRHGEGALAGELPRGEGHVSVFTPVAERDAGSWACCRSPREASRVVEFPLAPFLGTMGVAVAGGERPHSVPPGAHGGNIDINLLTEGAVLYLPVQVDGALAYVGDPHFAQGDGEVALTALEASLRATLRFEVVPRAEALAEFGEVLGPLVRTTEYLVPTGLDPDLDVAMRTCVRAAIALHPRTVGPRRTPRVRLPSAATDFDISQVVDIVCGVHARIRESDFDAVDRRGRLVRDGVRRMRIRASPDCRAPRTPPSRHRLGRHPRGRHGARRPSRGVLGVRDGHPRERPRRARCVVRAGARHDPRRRCRPARRPRRDLGVPGTRGGVKPRVIERIEHRALARRMPRCSCRSRASPAAARVCRPSCGSARRRLAHHGGARDARERRRSTARCGAPSAIRSARGRGGAARGTQRRGERSLRHQGLPDRRR